MQQARPLRNHQGVVRELDFARSHPSSQKRLTMLITEMKFEDLIGKTIVSVKKKKLIGSDDEGFLEMQLHNLLVKHMKVLD